jgi:phospholipase A1
MSRAESAPHAPEDCWREYPNDDHLRAQCYDGFFKPKEATRGSATPVQVPAAEASAGSGQRPSNEPQKDRCPPDHPLCKEWDLTSTRKRPEFGIEPHGLNYALAASWSDNRNIQPFSPTRGLVPINGSTRDATEVKFQFSLKSVLLDNRDSADPNAVIPGFDKFRLWIAYTQQSNWQAYNFANSAPFRETDYEPELIASFGRSSDATNLRWLKLLNFGAVHQSNGQSDPWSRSWNRLYVQAGFDFDTVMLLGRVWYRIPEHGLSDDNPGIENYVGRGDLVLRGYFDGAMVTVLHRNNFELHPNRSFTQLDISPCWFWFAKRLNEGAVRLHVQVTTGFGESLIDYNHHQTTAGVGLSFGDDANEYKPGACTP